MSDTKSAERVLAILEMFERERRPLSLKELAEYCRIPTSTCHGLVQTLLKHSYLYNTGQRKELYPTRKLYDMGAVIVVERRGPAKTGAGDGGASRVDAGNHDTGQAA